MGRRFLFGRGRGLTVDSGKRGERRIQSHQLLLYPVSLFLQLTNNTG